MRWVFIVVKGGRLSDRKGEMEKGGGDDVAVTGWGSGFESKAYRL
jgi:hypothetical protein